MSNHLVRGEPCRGVQEIDVVSGDSDNDILK